MTREEIGASVLDALVEVAPETDTASLRADRPFREQVDLDSFDFLNFMIALHARLGVEVPEADYSKLASLNAAVAYLSERLPG